MIAHCTAASLVSENKVLVHPASCDSLSTSGAKEDHVSMGKKTGGGIVAALVLVALSTCCCIYLLLYVLVAVRVVFSDLYLIRF